MAGKRSNEQQKKPLASQDSEEDTSSDSSNIPNTPSSKRLRTSAAPQQRVSSSASNLKKKKAIERVAGNPPAAASHQRVSEEDTSSNSSSSNRHSLQSTPPKNKGTEKNMVEIGVEEDAKKPLFQRLFSEDDEIALLEGLFSFMKDDAGDVGGPVNMVGFHQSMKGSFPTEIAKHQLSDKIKRLKKRFHKNKGRVFKPDSHESRIFELSNKIWGAKDLEKEKFVVPPNHYCFCKSGFVNSSFVGYAQEIFVAISEGRPTMKKKLKDLMIKECELEKEKIELFMNLLNSQAQ